MPLELGSLLVIGGLIVGGIGAFIRCSMLGLRRLRWHIEGVWFEIYLQVLRRCELIPQLLRVVRSHLPDQVELADTLQQMRWDAERTANRQEQAAIQGRLSMALKTVVHQTHRLAELRDDFDYMNLLRELALTESHLAISRDRYNRLIENHNTMVLKYPFKPIARGLKLSALQDFPMEITWWTPDSQLMERTRLPAPPLPNQPPSPRPETPRVDSAPYGRYNTR